MEQWFKDSGAASINYTESLQQHKQAVLPSVIDWSDVDMDNIPDYRDADPFSFRGAIVDENGVELDDDKDGVPNSKDLESNTRIGDMVNQFGISVNNSTYVNSEGMIYFPSVYFNSGNWS